MAHFALINAQGIVTQVIVAEQSFIDTLENSDSWIQTSYNGRIRKNFGGIGFKYDSVRDAFIPPQPFPSWTLNEDTCDWDCPIERPEETVEEMTAGKYYIWNEETHKADNTQGWVLVGGSID
jgi:hypothetical protein